MNTNIEHKTNKRRKGESYSKTSSFKVYTFFNILPDELVLIILSYGVMSDIYSTRLWQSKSVRYSTETRNKLEAACDNNNLDNMKWIHETIKDTTFNNDLHSNFTGTKISLPC